MNKTDLITKVSAVGEHIRPLVLEAKRPRGGGRTKPDLEVTISWEGISRQFAVQVKPKATPKEIEAALVEAKTAAMVSGALPMLLVPYLSDEALRRLQETLVSGVDLCGNVHIVVPGLWLISRTGEPNLFPTSRGIKSAYSGTSGLVPRVLLLKQQFQRLQDVENEIARSGGSIARGTISKVLKRLEDDLVVDRSSGIRVTDSSRLLERLKLHYAGPDIAQAETVLLAKDWEAQVATAAKRAGILAAVLSKPASESPERIYVQDLTSVLSNLPGRQSLAARELGEWLGIEIAEARDPGVFFNLRPGGALPRCDALQHYLEYQRAADAPPSVARRLREEILLAFGP